MAETSNEQTPEWSPTMLLRGDMEHPKHSGRYLVGVDEESYAEALAEIDRQREEIESLRSELWKVAECIWQNVHSDDAKRWARGIMVTLRPSAPPSFAVETTANRCVHGFSAVGCAQCDRDASKWRALRNCARITSMGSAGLLPEDTESDYAHLTLNFWTGVPPESPGPTWARDWLDKFVAKALHASPSEKAKEPQQTATNFECPECGAAVPHGMTCHHNL